jgi:hypothetical protein
MSAGRPRSLLAEPPGAGGYLGVPVAKLNFNITDVHHCRLLVQTTLHTQQESKEG